VISESDRGTYEVYRKNFMGFLGTAQRTDELMFDVYQETTTGATFGVPARLGVRWDPNNQVIVASSPSGDVGLMATILKMDSYQRARDEGPRWFGGKVATLASTWADPHPASFQLTNCVMDDNGVCDPDWPWSQDAGEFQGQNAMTSSAVNVILTGEVSGNLFLGTAGYTNGDFNEDLSPEDKINSLMLDVGALLLTDFPTQ
jgi:hypothetical protein